MPIQEPVSPGGDGVPLAVWPCRQVSAQYQRAGYPRQHREHPGKMLPELARRIVAAFTPEGGLVVDPMAGTGTTLVEAAVLGRRCWGVELEPRWVALATHTLETVLTAGQRELAEVRRGDARALPELLGEVAGRVDLVATSPPYDSAIGVVDTPGWRRGGSLKAPGSRIYADAAAGGNLGDLAGQPYREAMATVYAACHAVLRPGGVCVVVVRPTRRRGRVSNLAGQTVALARSAGFVYLQHIIAVHAGIYDSGLVAQPSLWQVINVRRARSRGRPLHLLVHQDVLVFHKPAPAARPRRDGGNDG